MRKRGQHRVGNRGSGDFGRLLKILSGAGQPGGAAILRRARGIARHRRTTIHRARAHHQRPEAASQTGQEDRPQQQDGFRLPHKDG